jgi:hypothetical protein
MVKPKSIVAAGLVVMAGIMAVFYFSPSEEKRVRKQFDLLSQYVKKEPGEDPFSMANRIQNISRLFADPCEFKIEGDSLYSFSGSYSRQEVAGYALRGRSYFSDLTLKFYDLKVQFPERGLSQVRLTARLTGRSSAGEQAEEIRELQCLLNKIEKKWLFSQFEVVEVLKR